MIRAEIVAVNDSRPRRLPLLFLRGVLLVAAAMAGFMLVQAVPDLLAGVRLGPPGRFSEQEAMHFNNLLNRNLNQLVAVVFMAVAIAVPLTANMYSLRFLELFIRDPVNGATLLFVVFVDAANTWCGYRMREGAIPAVQLEALFFLTVLCFAILVPYLYYIFRFLHPSTLLHRHEREIRSGLRAARRDPGRARAAVAAGIEHVANVAIRSIERGDRNPALEGVEALGRVLRAYWEAKPRLPRSWLEPDGRHFLGFSDAALEELRASGTWMEMKVYSQLHQIVGAAIGRQPELAATAAKTLRLLGQERAARSDAGVRELTVEYFNTLLRLALNRRETRAVFAILDQYRQLADALNGEFPALGEEIASYLGYYGQAARDLGLTFLAEAAAYDLAMLVRSAWEAGAPNRETLLERFLAYSAGGGAASKGVLKAQAILASYFAVRGESGPLAAIRRVLEHLGPALVAQVRDELLAVTREKYWEVSDRRVNVEYVPAPQREALRAFFASLSVPPPAAQGA
jgi:septum formation topological specificity factor MinE